ncbi:MAG TPA: hypothetical protein VJS39_12950 [Gemmatimonadaceae bacterium]|nr:hypothetical protein [Gemmatimonadaceae bacterium]
MFVSPRITRSALACCAFVIAACAKKENAAVDSSSVAASTTASTTNTAPAPAPTPINLADVAGKWNMRAVPTTGDTTANTYVLAATNSTTGWTITFPGRKPMPVQVLTDGDSIVITSPQYASVRRKGVQVTTNGALRLQNGDLVGATTAHYRVKTADSVLVLNVTGTRTK